MATAPENWGKCNFVYTEINHDLNPPVSKATLHSSNFVEAIKTGLDQGLYGCSSVNPDPHSFRDDPGVVQEILGMTLDQIHDDAYLKPGVETPFPVLSRMNNTNSQSVRTVGTLFKENKISTMTDTTYNNSLINNLFNPPAVNNPVNLYFIIDTGDELIARYLKPLSPANVVNLHVIHSMTTIGDSAMKKKPNAKDWKTNNPKVLIYSWFFNKNIIIAQNHEFFMSNYLITCRLVSGHSWHIGQTWSDGYNVVYSTINSNADNNKPNIRKELVKLIETKNSLTTKQKEFGLAVQKKRSGDHLQIVFAKEFPATLANPDNKNNFVYYSGSDNINVGKSLAPPHGTELEIKSRTYFVTGDWPAFCYACYLGINSIIIVRRGYILRAWFS